MSSRFHCVLAVAVALGAALPAAAQDGELARIREELRQLKEHYERRIEALERRLQDSEAKAARAEMQRTTVGEPASRTPPASAPRTESAFNPGISLILQGTVARSTRDPETYRIGGFAPSGGDIGPPPRGLSLAESELVVSASVDPYFRGHLAVALTPENSAEVEEAYFQTIALGGGLTIRGGRFLSGIGYQNEQHRHAWDFQDAPLVHQAFLGGRLNDDGVQLKWVAPTPFFLELGAELGRGRAFPATDRQRHGANAGSAFAHAGGDMGESLAWRAGLSYFTASPRGRAFEDRDALGNPVVQSFSGRSRLWIADFVLKWAPGGNATQTNFKLQGEYFRRSEAGTISYDDTAQVVPQFGTPLSDRYASRQSGWYLQGVYQFMPRWRLGFRHDRLHHGRIENGIVAFGAGPGAADFPLLMEVHHPRRSTAMLDWSPTESSRLRLQFADDRARPGASDRQAMLQYIFSLGAHGAHRF